MPALNYDYDYYKYERSRKSTKTSTTNKPRQTTSRAGYSASRNTTKSKGTGMYQTNRKQNRGITGEVNIPSKAMKTAQKPKEMILKKPKARSNKNTQVQIGFKAILGIAITVGMLLLICYRYSVINERFLEVKNLKAELAEVQTSNEQIEADIESKTDLKYVENYAKYQLGMQKPSPTQIQYVVAEKEDKIMSPVTIELEEEEDFFTKLYKEIRKFLD